MELRDHNILLTGAGGGLGQLLARAFAAGGARLALLDTNASAIEPLARELPESVPLIADLSAGDACMAAAQQAARELGEIDILVNLAGLMSFSIFEEEDPTRIERLIGVNLTAPMLLTRAVLPSMVARNSGQIVNVGSMFGSIGFACFAVYSASKFGLRGFSESLRRELADTAIRVTYISPRAVKTPINTGAIVQMNAETGVRMDEPGVVAEKIVSAIVSDRDEAFLGFPESLFAKINGILPRLLDAGTRKQNRIARSFATPGRQS